MHESASGPVHMEKNKQNRSVNKIHKQTEVTRKEFSCNGTYPNKLDQGKKKPEAN